MDRFQQQAFELITGPAAQTAFNIAAEDERIRDSYGRNSWGQSTLLARRLIEAGATFVTVHLNGWDHHFDIVKQMETSLPQLDAAVAALLEDLDDRGLLDQVLVVVCGEMGRTPKMNSGNGKGLPGRDHSDPNNCCQRDNFVSHHHSLTIQDFHSPHRQLTFTRGFGISSAGTAQDVGHPVISFVTSVLHQLVLGLVPDEREHPGPRPSPDLRIVDGELILEGIGTSSRIPLRHGERIA